MVRLFPKQVTQMGLPAGKDRIIAAWPVPEKSRVNGMWLEVSAVSETERVLLEAVFMLGLTCYIVPVPDPDTAITPDALWDAVIPKDTAVGSGVLDLDTSAVDTTPEFELGELDVTDFVDVGNSPVELFTRRELITFAKMPIGFHLDPLTDFTERFWVPTYYDKIRS